MIVTTLPNHLAYAATQWFNYITIRKFTKIIISINNTNIKLTA